MTLERDADPFAWAKTEPGWTCACGHECEACDADCPACGRFAA